MYTNIDTNIGIQAIKDFITSNESLLPTDFPSLLFLQILEIVMKNNVFAFKNTTWLQLSGTAMGTPTACAYATILYGHHENSKILPRFSKYLLYYKRYIDEPAKWKTTFGVGVFCFLKKSINLVFSL